MKTLITLTLIIAILIFCQGCQVGKAMTEDFLAELIYRGKQPNTSHNEREEKCLQSQ